MQMLSPVHVQAEKSNRGIRTTIVGSVAANVQAVEGSSTELSLGQEESSLICCFPYVRPVWVTVS